MDGELDRQLRLATDATARLLAALTGVDDGWCRAPRALPGWTRGHVLTHVARNADALRGLLQGTAAGREVTTYGPGDARDREIEAGAGRPAAELVADVAGSAGLLHDACREVPAWVWEAEPEWRAGRHQRLSTVPAARVVETEVHRLDLGAGYRPADWPEPAARVVLDVALARLSALAEPVPFAVQVPGEQPRGASPEVVSGSAAELAAWLLGRSDGSPLRGPDPLPRVPAVWS